MPMESVFLWRESMLFLLRTRRGRTGKKDRKRIMEGKKNKVRQNGSQRQHKIQSMGVINATFHSLIQPPPTLWLRFPIKGETDVYGIIMLSVSAAFETYAVRRRVFCALLAFGGTAPTRATPLQWFYYLFPYIRAGCSDWWFCFEGLRLGTVGK